MKRFYLAVAAAMALAACDPTTAVTSIPAAPVTIADRTTADERAASGVELAYQAWVYAVELGVDTGVFKGARAARLAEIDNGVYAAVVAMRYAYKTANANDYFKAYNHAKATIAQAITAAKGLK